MTGDSKGRRGLSFAGTAGKGDISIRPFTRADCGELLDLMRGLASFEGYIDDFAVTVDDLMRNGLSATPKFYAYVAQRGDGGPLLGMVVLYEIPWTYDMRPKLVMKELFVREQARGRGVGAALFSMAKQHARQINAASLNWTVLKDNTRAATFYKDFGGSGDPLWDNWLVNF